jgi:DNA modification methylase
MPSTRQLTIRYLPESSLRLDPKNPRFHSEKQIRQIARSIEAFGFNVPVVVDAKLQVIAGHGRVLASRQLKLAEVPTIQLDHLSDTQRRAFLIADNRLTENAAWDEQLLGEQLKCLSEAEIDFSLEVTGFEMAEIDLFIEGLASEGEAEEDRADALPTEFICVTRPGDLWCLGKHRVLCGDALDADSYSRLMEKKKASLLFTDPPYNVPIDGNTSGFGKTHYREFAMASGEMSEEQFTEFLRKSLAAAADNTLSGSMHFVCMDWRHMWQLLAAGTAIYSEFKNLCVWTKESGTMGSLYRSQHELVFVFKYGKTSHRNNIQLGKFGRNRTNVWNYPRANSFGRSSDEGALLTLHPTVKPVTLVADAILDCSARGELILDPFLGSGTTVIAAEKTGRTCYGLELDPQYVDIVVRRWQAFTGQNAQHATSGRLFNEIEKEVAHEL